MKIVISLLHPGDRFPTLSVALPGGDTPSLPDDVAGGFGVVLFYRGAWCPYCNAQLRTFQRAADNLDEVGTKVVTLSVDDEATTAELVAKPSRSRSGIPPTPRPSRQRRARSSIPSVRSSNPPGSCSTPPARWWSASTPRGRSAAWYPTTWSASSATCALIPRPRTDRTKP
jgi:hypothetical protein